jgi:hypothetical protein
MRNKTTTFAFSIIALSFIASFFSVADIISSASSYRSFLSAVERAEKAGVVDEFCNLNIDYIKSLHGSKVFLLQYSICIYILLIIAGVYILKLISKKN